MGKRELLIIVGFLVAGAVAYQLSAPADAGERGFSFSRFIDAMRREVRGNPGSATTEATGTIPVSAELSELRIGSTSRGVEVVGEDRADIAYVLTVSSNGPTDEDAMQYAKAVSLVQDDLGFALELSLSYPEEARQSAGLVLRVPARLRVRVEGPSTQVTQVAAVRLDGARGDTVVSDIAGGVSGAHRSGRLTIERAGSVELSLTTSECELNDVRGAVAITARNGECGVRGPAGPVTVEQVNLDLEIEAPSAPVVVTGTGGQIVIVDPRDDVRVETERAEIEVRLERGVTMTLITTQDTLRLMLAATANAAVDAIAAGDSSIQATEFEVEVERRDGESRLVHTFGSSPAPRVTLRNSRGDIVIRRSR